MKVVWRTLEGNGPVFPEGYKPRGVMVAGEVLSPLAEEMLWCYAPHYVKRSQYYQKPVFNKNFWSCFRPELTPAQAAVSFPDGYDEVLKRLSSERDIEREALKAERSRNKEVYLAEKQAVKDKYGYVMLDGKREPLMSYLVEEPGILIARGGSAELGLWKYRTYPEDIIINCSGNPPEPPAGHRWADVVCNPNFLGHFKYYVKLGNPARRLIEKAVRLTYSSSAGGTADAAKFDMALKLHKDWKRVYAIICRNVFNQNVFVAQAMVVTWLVANTAIRIGGSSSEMRENGVVGASTLTSDNIKIEQVRLSDGTVSPTELVLRLNFVGKDSIVYDNNYYFDSVKHPDDFKVCQKLAGMLAVKSGRLFDVTSADVNAVLKQIMPGLSAKIFRPAKGTALLCQALSMLKSSPFSGVDLSTDAGKLRAFKEANLKTARLLNHKRTVSSAMEASILKSKETLKERLKRMDEGEVYLRSRLKDATGAEAEKYKLRLAKLLVSRDAAQERIKFREKAKADALGTSLGSYLDPRAVVSWCKEAGLPVDKLYSKSLRARFGWAMDADVSVWRQWI